MKKRLTKIGRLLIYASVYFLSILGVDALCQYFWGDGSYGPITFIYIFGVLGFIACESQEKKGIIKGNIKYIKSLKERGDISEYAAESILKDLYKINELNNDD